MDFSSRGAVQTSVPGIDSPTGAHKKPTKNNPNKKDFWQRIGVSAAILCVVILLIGVVIALYAGNSNNKDTESKYVYGNKLQAVFLNTGQVYFGNIKELNNNFLVLTNIFYLQTNSSGSSTTTTTSSSNVSLVKLGCELHMPYDQMVINRSAVTFWENLQANGQVAKAVSTYNSEHPNGQSCSDQSSSSSSNSSATTQPSSSTSK